MGLPGQRMFMRHSTTRTMLTKLAEGNDGYYEIRRAGTKGNGAFALKDISAGTRILVDNALFMVPLKGNKISISASDFMKILNGLSMA